MASSLKKPGYDHLLKLIIIGDSSVGKTCILLRFSEDNFPVSHMPTIGKFFLSISSIISYQFWSSHLNIFVQVSTSK